MFSQPVVAAEGGKRPPNTLKIPISSSTRELLLSKPNNPSSSHEELIFLEAPLKKKSNVITLKANPTLPREELFKRFLSPWLKTLNDDIIRINSTTYFAGQLKIYFNGNLHLSNFHKFIETNCDTSGVHPEIDTADKKSFENKFGCEILFFLKSARTAKFIPKAVVKAPADRRDALIKERCCFQGMEVNFSMNDISRLDDFTFPRCSIWQSWGHWSQRCPTKKSVCAFCARNHHSSTCPKDLKCCANCKKEGHCAFSKSCPIFKQYLNWAQRTYTNNSAKSVRPAPSKIAAHESAPPPPNKWPSERTSPDEVSIDEKLRHFSDKIMQMVDLRINMAIQGIEKRLASHLDALMATITSRLDNLFPHGSIDSPISCKRVRKASPVNPNLSNSDVEMHENELFVRDIIQEQSQVCETGVHKLIQECSVRS
ncbi:hypothetical protein ACOME3_004759 [Neoechinorhynchus agilis]